MGWVEEEESGAAAAEVGLPETQACGLREKLTTFRVGSREDRLEDVEQLLMPDVFTGFDSRGKLFRPGAVSVVFSFHRGVHAGSLVGPCIRLGVRENERLRRHVRQRMEDLAPP